MSVTASTLVEKVALRSLGWVGLLAAVLSVAANAVIRTIAKAAFEVPDGFQPFTFGQFTFVTVAGVAGATLVLGFLGGLFNKAGRPIQRARPIRSFRRLAVGALVLSWIPALGLLAGRPYPGTTVQSVGTLMVMHTVTAVITVGLLTTLGRER